MRRASGVSVDVGGVRIVMGEVGRPLRRRAKVAARLAVTSSGMPDAEQLVGSSSAVYGGGSSFSIG